MASRPVTNVLVDDHNEIGALLCDLQEASLPSQSALVGRLAISLRAHARAEDTLLDPFYGAVAPDESSREARDFYRARWVVQALDALESSTPGTRAFARHLRILSLRFAAHADRQEESLFPVLEQSCSFAELRQLGSRVLEIEAGMRPPPGRSLPDVPVAHEPWQRG